MSSLNNPFVFALLNTKKKKPNAASRLPLYLASSNVPPTTIAEAHFLHYRVLALGKQRTTGGPTGKSGRRKRSEGFWGEGAEKAMVKAQFLVFWFRFVLGFSRVLFFSHFYFVSQDRI